MNHNTAAAEQLLERADRSLLITSPIETDTVVSADGCWLQMLSGSRLLDLGAGQVCATLGHNAPEINLAIADQLKQVSHCCARFLTQHLIEAAETVLDITPEGLDKVAFLSTGTEANEFAIRMSQLNTGRSKILSFSNGYFGTSALLRSLSRPFMHYSSNSHFTQHSIQMEFDANADSNAILRTCRSLSPTTCKQIAAIITEPIMGTGGIWPLPDGTLRELRAFATEIGALLIFDESQTGMGRTGKWFACEHDKATPDILVFAKCAGNTFPVSCVVTREEVVRRARREGFFYISSHQSDPLACRVVNATIQCAKRLNTPFLASQAGSLLIEGLKNATSDCQLVADVRGRGLLIGIEFKGNDKVPAARIARAVFQRCLTEGVVFGYGDWAGILRLAPPLTISKEEISYACATLYRTLNFVGHLVASNGPFPAWSEPNSITSKFFCDITPFIERQTRACR